MNMSQVVSAIQRYPGTTLAALVVLAAGVAFGIRGGTGTTTYIDKKTEIVTCTNTGGLAKYAYCNWQEPVDDAGSGSVVTGITYSVGKSPKVIGVDGTVGKSATASGAYAIQNITNVQTTSGGTVVFLTGAILVDSGSYVRLVTLTNPTSAHTASMMIEYTTRLSR